MAVLSFCANRTGPINIKQSAIVPFKFMPFGSNRLDLPW